MPSNATCALSLPRTATPVPVAFHLLETPEKRKSALAPIASLAHSSAELLKRGQLERLPTALATIEGRLQLQGSGRWVGSRLRFEGEASAAPEHEAALSNLLNIIGRRSGARSIITVG